LVLELALVVEQLASALLLPLLQQQYYDYGHNGPNRF
jgi:hypothetical protein